MSWGIQWQVMLSLDELEQYASPDGWVDVCKGWFVNGD